MTLIKVAKRVTPEFTFFAYKRVDGKTIRYYWVNPYNNKLLPIKHTELKTWQPISANA